MLPTDTGPVFLVIGTSFAVDDSRLVTNAHVVDGVLEFASLAAPDVQFIAVQHETGAFLEIDRMWKHPDYDSDNFIGTPDIGVIEVQGILPTKATLAGTGTARGLSVLDAVSLCGFPSDITFVIDLAQGSVRPRVTCLSGNITALRPFDPSDAATPTNTFLIQHDIQASEGTSGSAIFDAAGRVIAVNNAATLDAAASNRFAVRVDLVQGFLDDIDGGRVSSVPVDVCLENGWYGDGRCDTLCPQPDPDCNVTDVCAENGWYGDGECDTFCPLPDPDCDPFNQPGFGDGGDDAPVGECPPTSYRNEAFGFGFNPPEGFDGPLADDTPYPSDLLSVDFEFDGLLQIDIDVVPTDWSLVGWVNAWVNEKTENGETLIASEQLTMFSGTEATILTWLAPGFLQDSYWIEFWAIRPGLGYGAATYMSPLDFILFQDDILVSYRSFCVD